MSAERRDILQVFQRFHYAPFPLSLTHAVSSARTADVLAVIIVTASVAGDAGRRKTWRGDWCRDSAGISVDANNVTTVTPTCERLGLAAAKRWGKCVGFNIPQDT